MTNETLFNTLFQEVCQKCFGHPLTQPLSETDSKVLVNSIFEQTGLVIGVKSIKNYSQYVTNPDGTKKENPSVATLDTLARYVLNAPYTTEIQRKKNESHYPFWFQYKNRFSGTSVQKKKLVIKKTPVITISLLLLAAVILLFIRYTQKAGSNKPFVDEFATVNSDSLKKKGWIIQHMDSIYWKKRQEKKGHLSLYTLVGDNWQKTSNQPGISNLLVKKITADCFITEIHLTDFVPAQNWQQAGILLSEDSTFTGNVLRMSIGYNNFFGGYEKPGEIIIQVVGSSENGRVSKPEEIAHMALFSAEPGKEQLVAGNLSKSALKIEKKNNQYRFLYTYGQMEKFAFKEAASGHFSIQPKYIGIFAMQGLAEKENPMPVQFDSFYLLPLDCGK